ncbi:threonine--tRNA ligase [Candidatus Kaiserbacteria bacterium CG10_big_fil_rev_8_21_14_0_10_45_20]|uniref:Threonine--tRNA ligase n=1 Tax=Candidatus Kaiserbacteria bacterium CG10_big_fil_rev_8_21_14_0_10_45_20 TaxID=1974607 RepID=A0A2H0UEZ9_9BACT|nr:MAG: threonine--tRNA ligase [Candidatus Kaiserbacteria bacterium CG10_big_fil_rev_8_21_14_0_10_45_20]
MNKELEYKRHTLAHLLAAAVMELYPDTKRTIGPAVDNGFYFDFEFSTPVTEKDFPAIEKKMRNLLPSWTSFEKHELSAEDAKAEYPDNPYKHELIEEFTAEGQKVSFYKSGSYWDLCRGGHLENPAKEIAPDSFKLDRVAGAYWRGDEKNTMLTRIYGLAFDTKEELDAYQAQREEAKKRDHRKIGKELDLFTFSELVGPGLPLWTPKGTLVRHLLDGYVWELREKYGYERVTIPHITKRDLYEKSGHWEKFADELFRIKTREDKEFALKPMNCPHHTQIFDRHPHSYRDMPQRFAETTMVYRDEQSGELGGLTRVLSITQDDSHVFCRHSQVKDEYFKIWDIVDTFYGTFGFNLKVRLSFHDPKSPEKYLGNADIWKNAEDALRDIAKERKADYVEAPGEAAMYGPKLDFMAVDSMRREHQVATIQLDMNLPERFDLHCINEQGEKERIVMVHCAIMGSIERFSAVLLEHLAGVLPLWLAPVQVRVLPVSDKHTEYAKVVATKLKEARIRAEVDEANDSLGKKIRQSKVEKIPYFLVIGDKEVEANTVTVESRDKGNLGTENVEALILNLREDIDSRAR